MRNRVCINKPVPRLGGATFSHGINFATITFPLEGDKRDKWFFYDNGKWISMEITVAGGQKLLDDGTWECDGNENFKIVAGGYVYTSDIDDWVRSSTEPEPSAGSTTQPPATPEQPIEPEKDDSFPLKMGKEGPNVVKLQKFLNDKVPSNPLTVNGTFDQKTNDKLIEYQKREGIIQ